MKKKLIEKESNVVNLKKLIKKERPKKILFQTRINKDVLLSVRKKAFKDKFSITDLTEALFKYYLSKK